VFKPFLGLAGKKRTVISAEPAKRCRKSQEKEVEIWAMELGMGKSEIRAIAENMLDVRGKANVRAKRPWALNTCHQCLPLPLKSPLPFQTKIQLSSSYHVCYSYYPQSFIIWAAINHQMRALAFAPTPKRRVLL